MSADRLRPERGERATGHRLPVDEPASETRRKLFISSTWTASTFPSEVLEVSHPGAVPPKNEAPAVEIDSQQPVHLALALVFEPMAKSVFSSTASGLPAFARRSPWRKPFGRP
jgi:hypothetical protein